MGDVASGDCEAAFVVATPDLVREARTRVGAEFEATDLAVQACAALAPEERAEWAIKLGAWRASLLVEPDWWNANALFRSACAFAKDLDGYRASFRARNCKVLGPESVHGNAKGPFEGLSDTVKTVAIGGAVVAGAVVLVAFLPEIKALFRARRK